MQVIVQLAEKELLWSFPGSAAILTKQTPRVAIETDKLNEQQKQALALGLAGGRLLSDTKPEQFFVPKAKPFIPPAPVVQSPEVARSNALALQAKDLISRSVAEIKKELLLIKDIRLLKFMLILEESGRKRPSVVKTVSDSIRQFETSVIRSAQESGEPIVLPDPAKIKVGGQTVNYDVVESVGEKVSIQYKKKNT